MKSIPIDCKQVIREVSNFIDGEVPLGLRTRMDVHFAECAHCLAILDGIRNVVRLVGDGVFFELPVGFSNRLARRIFELHDHDA